MTIRALADKQTVAAKLARIHEPHIVPLLRWPAAFRHSTQRRTCSSTRTTAALTPACCLAGSAGPKATDFVSQDNNDKTAENLNRLMSEAGLQRREIVLWNVVPFYIGAADRSKLRAARQGDLEAGRPWLSELFGLLPRIDAVVLLGRKSQQARPLVNAFRPVARVLEGWHPSPLAMNRDPARRRQLLGVLHEAATSHAD
ncbi:MAG: uracil-DNA glycosylase [Burkholderiaceae bacterium]|nr:uracil-DNA glycosylase [Burkholderiaceae bacterium]